MSLVLGKFLRKFFGVIWLNVVLMCLLPHLVFAQVVINEVHPAPSSGNDWVELANTGIVPVSLANWTLEDSSSAMPTTPNLSTISIAPQAYTVIEVSNRLNNTGDSVFLKNPVGQIIDQFVYTSSQTSISWARVPDSTGNFVLSQPTRGIANSSDFVLPSPSPSPTANPTPSPVPTPSPTPPPSLEPTPQSYPTSFQLSEIMACPETNQKEWVELYNPDSAAYQLTNWKLKDSTGNTRLLNGTIAAQSYDAFDLSSSMFNNTGDTVSLETPNGVELFTAQFGECQKGRSFVFYDEDWQETLMITKGTSNVYLSPDAPQEATQTLPVNTTVTFNTNSTASAQLADLSNLNAASVSAQFYPLINQKSASAGFATGAAEFDDPTAPQQEKSSNTKTNGNIHSHLPTWLLFLMFVVSFSLLLSGGFGFYQWYTERHVEEEDTGFP